MRFLFAPLRKIILLTNLQQQRMIQPPFLRGVGGIFEEYTLTEANFLACSIDSDFC
jgi:hypothetical protein